MFPRVPYHTIYKTSPVFVPEKAMFQSIHHVANHVVVSAISAHTNSRIYFDVSCPTFPLFVHHLVQAGSQMMFARARAFIHRIPAPIVDFIHEELMMLGIHGVDLFDDFLGIHGVEVARVDFPLPNFMFIIRVEFIKFAPQVACNLVFHFAHHRSRPSFFNVFTFDHVVCHPNNFADNLIWKLNNAHDDFSSRFSCAV